MSAEDQPTFEKNIHGKAYYHLILLAKNNQGLKNLFRLSTRASAENSYYKPRATTSMLADHSEDILVTSACLGSYFSQLIMAGDHKAAERSIDEHARMFPDRFFIELQTHETPEQQMVNQILIDIGTRKNLPLVLTSDAHYTHKHDKTLHQTVLRMNTNAQPDDDGFSFGGIECHLHGHDELAQKCLQQSIPYEAISNTTYVAAMIDHQSYFQDRKNHLPSFKSLPPGMTSWQYLEAIAYGGLIRRVGFPVPPEYEARFQHELSSTKYAGLSDYLLIVWEFMEAAKSLDVLTGAGRGSAAGSLICWALGITQVDPIKYGLLYSRFLNTGRLGSPIIF